MVLSAIEAEPVCSKPPASVGVRISTGTRLWTLGAFVDQSIIALRSI